MRIYDAKNLVILVIGMGLALMPMTTYALDKKRTISRDELSNSYGTINKKYDQRRPTQPPTQQFQRPLDQSLEKGSFAYSLGNDAVKVGDLASAVKYWKLSSADGNFYANWQLARYNLGHLGAAKNDKQAIHYLKMVVDQYDVSSESRSRRQISANAMVEFAVFYINGSQTAGFKSNISVALRLLKLASSSVGHSQANFLLGELYFDDQYIKPQRKRAVRYYTLAARKNYFLAQVKLGQIYYLQGRNIQAKVRGLAWLMVAQTNKPPELKKYVNDIIAQFRGKKLTNKQFKSAEKMADSIVLKRNF